MTDPSEDPMAERTETEAEFVDPDPFIIGLGILQIVAAGGAFLESRRQRREMQRAQRQQFRATWYAARRSVIFLKRTTDEFETYMFEGAYGRRQFRIGAVRLSVDPVQHQAMRRMHGQTMKTAQHLADDLDDLSNYLGPEDQSRIDDIHDRLNLIDQLPAQYRDVIVLAREAVQLYSDLLEDVGEREQFESDNEP